MLVHNRLGFADDDAARASAGAEFNILIAIVGNYFGQVSVGCIACRVQLPVGCTEGGARRVRATARG